MPSSISVSVAVSAVSLCFLLLLIPLRMLCRVGFFDCGQGSSSSFRHPPLVVPLSDLAIISCIITCLSNSHSIPASSSSTVGNVIEHGKSCIEIITIVIVIVIIYFYFCSYYCTLTKDFLQAMNPCGRKFRCISIILFCS